MAGDLNLFTTLYPSAARSGFPTAETLFWRYRDPTHKGMPGTHGLDFLAVSQIESQSGHSSQLFSPDYLGPF